MDATNPTPLPKLPTDIEAEGEGWADACFSWNDKSDNPYPAGTAAHRGWLRGFARRRIEKSRGL